MKGLASAYTSSTTDVTSQRPIRASLRLSSPLTFSERKRLFLQRLQPLTGKTKYKRYVASPLRYAGGKTLAVGLIVELIPDNIHRLISPFLGGGSLEIAVANELNIPVKAFDIFDILINYWDAQINHSQSLYQRLKLAYAHLFLCDMERAARSVVRIVRKLTKPPMWSVC